MARTSPTWIVLVLALACTTLGLSGCIADGGGTDGGPGVENNDTNTTPSLSWAAVEDAGIRPGVTIAGSCTSNFLFESPSNRSFYVGTAAHCVDRAGVGASVSVAGFANGTVAWVGENHPANVSTDFALVRMAPSYRSQANPGTLVHGGPTGLAAAETVHVGDKVYTYGNSSFRSTDDRADAREGKIENDSTKEGASARFHPPSIPGDSGSAVLDTDGVAVGWISTIRTFVVSPSVSSPYANSGTNGIGYLERALDLVREDTNGTLDPQLATHPDFDPEPVVVPPSVLPGNRLGSAIAEEPS